MRRRICVGLALVAPALVGVGSTVASAASPTSVVLRCGMSMTVAPLQGNSGVDQPPPGGKMYGPNRCPKPGFGQGLMAARFNVPESGDWVGNYTQYLHAGTISGKFDLVPQEGGPISQNFTAQAWAGTVTVSGGTGVYSGVQQSKKGKKGAGVLKCSSPDTVHLSCTEKIKIT